MLGIFSKKTGSKTKNKQKDPNLSQNWQKVDLNSGVYQDSNLNSQNYQESNYSQNSNIPGFDPSKFQFNDTPVFNTSFDPNSTPPNSFNGGFNEVNGQQNPATNLNPLQAKKIENSKNNFEQTLNYSQNSNFKRSNFQPSQLQKNQNLNPKDFQFEESFLPEASFVGQGLNSEQVDNQVSSPNFNSNRLPNSNQNSGQFVNQFNNNSKPVFVPNQNLNPNPTFSNSIPGFNSNIGNFQNVNPAQQNHPINQFQNPIQPQNQNFNPQNNFQNPVNNSNLAFSNGLNPKTNNNFNSPKNPQAQTSTQQTTTIDLNPDEQANIQAAQTEAQQILASLSNDDKEYLNFINTLVAAITGLSLLDIAEQQRDSTIEKCITIFSDFIVDYVKTKYGEKEAMRLKSAQMFTGENVFAKFQELGEMFDEAYQVFLETLKTSWNKEESQIVATQVLQN